jgi:hypothetical protein
MWPFPAKIEPKEPEKDPRSIESRMRALELDWEDTYERIRKVLQRISKRAEFVEKAEKRAEEDVENSHLGAQRPTQQDRDGRTAVGGMLSQRQKEIQAQILRRRAGG